MRRAGSFGILVLVLVCLQSIEKNTVSCWSTKTATTAAAAAAASTAATTRAPAACPLVSPATSLPNQFYTWKQGQQIRYQCAGPLSDKDDNNENNATRRHRPAILLVHGLFVNSDHWRKTLPALAQAGYRAYALDLLGCGYSDKPCTNKDDTEGDDSKELAKHINGEVWRFDDGHNGARPSVLVDVALGTARGGHRVVKNMDLRHPLGSIYNFFTWSDLLTDFTRDVILSESAAASSSSSKLSSSSSSLSVSSLPQDKQQVALVCNSIGTISSFQALIDQPDLFQGVFVISPNFRELHSAEMIFPALTMPIVRAVQSLLRQYGQPAYDFLTKPAFIKQILRVPYARRDAVDDELVQVLLDPLLTPGSSKVVFDTLSYSAGPLPEQQLREMIPTNNNKPVWICYGRDDPWTPGPRVEALLDLPPVERVQGLDGVGHCPHDEAPELVHPLLFEFLNRLERGHKIE
jgi:pimeloyl-ACP methyl ester carboxylesterase